MTNHYNNQGFLEIKMTNKFRDDRKSMVEVDGIDNIDDCFLVNNNSKFHEKKILIVGSGGIGCEIVKNLALSDFRNIHLV